MHRTGHHGMVDRRQEQIAGPGIDDLLGPRWLIEDEEKAHNHQADAQDPMPLERFRSLVLFHSSTP